MPPPRRFSCCCASHLALGAERKFELKTESAEAKTLLADLQARVENFEAGPHLLEIAQKIMAADPKFAMGQYYLSVFVPPNEGPAQLEKAVELGKNASEGERRFIEAMAVVRANQGANFRDGIPLLEKVAADYPGERLPYMLLGQLYQGANESDKARATFEKALDVGPDSARARSFIANDDLLRGKYAESRAAFESIERSLPRESLPFVIRYGVAFSYLYEDHPDGGGYRSRTVSRRVQRQRREPGISRSLHLELHRANPSRERRRFEGDGSL